MKKIFTLVLSVLSLLNSFAQTTELWGVNTNGGLDNQGRIVRVNPTTNAASELYGCPIITAGGTINNGVQIVYNGFLYGVLTNSGKSNTGIIYKYDPMSNLFEKLYDFESGSDGRIGRVGSTGLCLFNNKMYGTAGGGANDKGVIYEFDPATNICTKKFDFTSSFTLINSNQIGGALNILSAYNDKLYATTDFGGTNNKGVIYEFDPATSACVAKLSLNNNATVGYGCFGGLTLHNNKFYGAMRNAFSNPHIFEWDPVTNIYTNKIAIGSGYPSVVLASLDARMTSNGTVLYFAANQGGAS